MTHPLLHDMQILVARDDVEWDSEQEQLAEAKVMENSSTKMSSQDKGD